MKDNKVYVEASFQIEAGYTWGQGMSNEASSRFKEEIREIFSGLGFQPNTPPPIESITVTRGAERMYCHPMRISGYIDRDSLGEIESALNKANTFKLERVSVYDEALNFTKEEFIDELNKKADMIKEKIIATFATKRRNQYSASGDLLLVKSEIPYLHRYEEGDVNLEGVESGFISRLFQELVNEGKIIKKDNQSVHCYRSVTPRKKKAI